MLFRATLALFKMAEIQILETKSSDELMLLFSGLPKTATNPQEFIDLCFDPTFIDPLPRSKIDLLRELYGPIIEEEQLKKNKRKN